MKRSYVAFVLGALAVVPSLAQATLGTVMTDAAESVTENVLIVVPIALGVGALCLSIAYAWRWIRKTAKA